MFSERSSFGLVSFNNPTDNAGLSVVRRLDSMTTSKLARYTRLVHLMCVAAADAANVKVQIRNIPGSDAYVMIAMDDQQNARTNLNRIGSRLAHKLRVRGFVERSDGMFELQTPEGDFVYVDQPVCQAAGEGLFPPSIAISPMIMQQRATLGPTRPSVPPIETTNIAPYERDLVEAVSAALDAGLHLTKDIIGFVARRLPDPAQERELPEIVFVTGEAFEIVQARRKQAIADLVGTSRGTWIPVRYSYDNHTHYQAFMADGMGRATTGGSSWPAKPSWSEVRDLMASGEISAIRHTIETERQIARNLDAIAALNIKQDSAFRNLRIGGHSMSSAVVTVVDELEGRVTLQFKKRGSSRLYTTNVNAEELAQQSVPESVPDVSPQMG